MSWKFFVNEKKESKKHDGALVKELLKKILGIEISPPDLLNSEYAPTFVYDLCIEKNEPEENCYQNSIKISEILESISSEKNLINLETNIKYRDMPLQYSKKLFEECIDDYLESKIHENINPYIVLKVCSDRILKINKNYFDCIKNYKKSFNKNENKLYKFCKEHSIKEYFTNLEPSIPSLISYKESKKE